MKAPLPNRLRRAVCSVLMRGGLRFYLEVLAVIRRFVARRNPLPDSHIILLTGRFESQNWADAHLKPLATSRQCRRLYVVTTYPLSILPGVTAIVPPSWLRRMVGDTTARLVTLFLAALRIRPTLVGGFALFPNGMAAALTAAFVGARAMYFCVGGPIEVLDGGVHKEIGPFALLEAPDDLLERKLTQAVDHCDLVITMGTKAADFFRQKRIHSRIHVVPGGIDAAKFECTLRAPAFDLIFVGRLVEIKRVDLFLHVVKLVVAAVPTATAAVVGDGLLRDHLQELTRDLGLDRCVRFAGHQREIGPWLQQSRLFMLTSRSEGLSLALMEAMMTGLPAVVSHVGDLDNLVEHGLNGFLINSSKPSDFAGPVIDLLTDERKHNAFSQAARHSALKNEMSRVTCQWDTILADLREP